eukprot:6191622-Pleurochrysis_carterae.AAC.2
MLNADGNKKAKEAAHKRKRGETSNDNAADKTTPKVVRLTLKPEQEAFLQCAAAKAAGTQSRVEAAREAVRAEAHRELDAQVESVRRAEQAAVSAQREKKEALPYALDYKQLN